MPPSLPSDPGLAAFGSSLTAITLAELGDKTFFMALILAARHRPRWVFIGAFASVFVKRLDIGAVALQGWAAVGTLMVMVILGGVGYHYGGAIGALVMLATTVLNRLMVVEFGLLAPPVGLNVYVVNGMAKDIPIAESYRGVMPFLVSDTIRTLLILFFPGICLWLVSVIT